MDVVLLFVGEVEVDDESDLVDVTLKGIKQFYINCNSDDIKFENMLLIFGHMDITQCIIYVNTVEKSVNLAAKMRERDFAVSYINGDMPQEDRMKIMREFRSGKKPPN